MQVYYHSMTQKRLMYQLVFGQQEDRHQMKSERGVEQLLCHFGYSIFLDIVFFIAIATASGYVFS